MDKKTASVIAKNKATKSEQLLFNTLTDGDSYSSVTFAVYWKRNENGTVQFEVTYYQYA